MNTLRAKEYHEKRATDENLPSWEREFHAGWARVYAAKLDREEPICWFSPDPCHYIGGPGFCRSEAVRLGWADTAAAGDGCAYHRGESR